MGKNIIVNKYIMIHIFNDMYHVPNVIIETKITSFCKMPNSIYVYCYPNNHNKKGILELFYTHSKFDILYEKLKVGAKYKFKIVCRYMINNNSHIDIIHDIINC